MFALSRPLGLGMILVFCLAHASIAKAEVLLWTVDARQGTEQMADSAEWAQFVVAQGKAQSLTFKQPTEVGLLDEYSELMSAAPNRNRLAESADLLNAQASLWVRLDSLGATWLLVKDNAAVSSTSLITSEGLAQGVAWAKQRLSVPVEQWSGAAEPEGIAPDPNFVYQPPGASIEVIGIRDGSDFLRLTQSIESLGGVDFVFASEVRSQMARLSIGSQIDDLSLKDLLSQQAWLEPIGEGRYRWIAMSASLTPTPGAQQRAPIE